MGNDEIQYNMEYFNFSKDLLSRKSSEELLLDKNWKLKKSLLIIKVANQLRRKKKRNEQGT